MTQDCSGANEYPEVPRRHFAQFAEIFGGCGQGATESFYPFTVEVSSRLPVLTFLPAGYEPEYAYPLVIFFPGRGDDERRLRRWAPQLSRRNYICLGLRGPQAVAGPQVLYHWGHGADQWLLVEDYVFTALAELMRTRRIHPHRVFLVGVREGAEAAYRLALSFPERFAGVVALNGHLPTPCPLLRLSAVRRLPAFIGHGIANPYVPLSYARQAYRYFYTAGAPVVWHTYATTHRLHPHMFRDVNQWLMSCCAASGARIEASRRPV
ncbi:MAG: hypothetical protein C4297_05375 [Gemmataceae bacterium]